MNENKALEDVILQLKSTTEQIELKLESTTNEVLYLRQVAATQQKVRKKQKYRCRRIHA